MGMHNAVINSIVRDLKKEFYKKTELLCIKDESKEHKQKFSESQHKVLKHGAMTAVGSAEARRHLKPFDGIWHISISTTFSSSTPAAAEGSFCCWDFSRLPHAAPSLSTNKTEISLLNTSVIWT